MGHGHHHHHDTNNQSTRQLMLAIAINVLLTVAQVIGGLVWCFVDTDVHRRFEWVYEYRCAYGVYDSNRNPKHAAQVLQEQWT